jgi:hypothetical protein
LLPFIRERGGDASSPLSGKLKADLIIETEAGHYIVELQAGGEPEDVREH